MKRQVFYSFHYSEDAWRTSQARNIGAVEGNKTASDNDWEQVKRGGDLAIKRWISKQMEYRSCTVVLIGQHTANRKWINHEIIESWKENMGIVGIHIHGLKGADRKTSQKGQNPFDCISFNGGKLSSVVKCYNPTGYNSKDKYNWIERNLSDAIEKAIKIRNRYD